MHGPNFCAECGDRLARKGWRALLRRRFCGPCAQRLGNFAAFRPIIVVFLVSVAAFVAGRYMRPKPPPLIIQRAANSPLSDGPVLSDATQNSTNRNRSNPEGPNPVPATANEDEVYICGARTKKGTPCRRRVHAPGERCFQHKGMPAMVPLEKLVIKSNDQRK